MSTSHIIPKSRKQREIEHREHLILDAARRQLASVGYFQFNMDSIAGEIEYSKGTIYQHFKNKEDILLGLAAQTMEKRAELFDRASAFRGESRERILAIGLASDLFMRLYPEHFRVEQILRSASFWERTSEERRQLLKGCEFRCFGIVTGIIRDAISGGHLSLPAEMSPEELTFGLWSMSYGAHTIIATSQSLEEIGLKNPHESVFFSFDKLLDGYRWTPLSQDWDYDQSKVRILTDVFPHEWTLIQKQQSFHARATGMGNSPQER